MISYQATLPVPPTAVVAVRAQSVRPPGWQLGGGVPTTSFQVVIRYAVKDGRVLTHRGLVRAAVPPDRPLRVAAWQVKGNVVAMVLVPALHPRKRQGRRTVVDRFSLPVLWEAPGVEAVEATDVHARVVASGHGDSLLVRGVVFIQLQAKGTDVPVRIPFGRLLAVPAAGEFRWQVQGGVAGMRLTVDPAGQIEGEITLVAAYTGIPDGPQPPEEAGGILQVREMAATVTAVGAEPAGSDLVLVQGTVEVDVYWVDSHHRSRWAGKEVPFGGIAHVPGVQKGDRLEVQAEVQRIGPVLGCGPGTAVLLLKTTVLHLRLSEVSLGTGRYRLEKVVGEVSFPIEVQVHWAEPEWITGSLPEEILTVPELRLPEPWRELSVKLGARTGSGDRWWLQASLEAERIGGADRDGGGCTAGGEPAGAGCARAAGGCERVTGHWLGTHTREGNLPPGAGACAVVLPSLQRVGPDGLSVRTAVVPAGAPVRRAWAPRGRGEQSVEGPAAAAPQGRAPRRVQVGRLDVPAGVRWILGIRAEGGREGRVQVLAAAKGGLRLLEGPMLQPAGANRPAALTVYVDTGKKRGLVVVGEY